MSPDHLPRPDFTKAAQNEKATPEEVQQAIGMIAKAGFELDATAYVHAKRGRELFAEDMAKHDIIIEPHAPDDHCFFFKKGDIHLALSWSLERAEAEIGIHNGPIGIVGTTQDYSVREFLAAAPFEKTKSFTQQVAETLPEQWRKPFLNFVETGDADEALTAYLDHSKQGQAAVEKVFNHQAEAMQKLAEEFRRHPQGPKR